MVEIAKTAVKLPGKPVLGNVFTGWPPLAVRSAILLNADAEVGVGVADGLALEVALGLD